MSLSRASARPALLAVLVPALALATACGGSGGSSAAGSASTSSASPSVSASTSASTSASAAARGAGAVSASSRTFSVSAPSGWHEGQFPGAAPAGVRYELVLDGPRAEGFMTNINVVSQVVPAGTGVDAVARAGIEKVRSSGFQVLQEPQPVEVAGSPGQAYALALTAQGKKVLEYQVLTVHGGRAYFTTLSSGPTTYEPSLPLLRKVVDSWRWS